MNMVKNKYRSTLTNEHLHQCLRLTFTPFMPKFKPQKSVTFYTNKTTSSFVHSSNVFVGVMFLDFDRHCSGRWSGWKFCAQDNIFDRQTHTDAEHTTEMC